MNIKQEQVKALLIDQLLDAKQPGLSKQPSCRYRDELGRKSYSELWELYEPVRQANEKQEGEKRRVEDVQRMRAIAERWARKSYWTKHEAVALLLRLDPMECLERSGRGAYLSVPSHLEREADDLEDLIERAVFAKHITEKLSPAVLLRWLENHRVYVPPELQEEVGKHAEVSDVSEQPAKSSNDGGDSSEDEPEHELESTIKGTTIERRIQAILIAISLKGWNAQSINEGGKQEILSACLTQHGLFSSESVFKKAWQKALDRGVLKTEKHEVYSKRG